MGTSPLTPAVAPSELARRYQGVRAQTCSLVAGLGAEDCQLQSMPDASPTKWHLAHVTWFFETFVLERFEAGFRAFDPAFRVLFNSYYTALGARHPRAQRGLIGRPTLAQVMDYRASVDDRLLALLQRAPEPELALLIELGLQHEQQHQELILTDIKHALSCNPTSPAYRAGWPLATVAPVPLHWVDFEGGLVQVGHPGAGAGFAFDNESPRHRVYLEPYRLASRLSTHDEWAAFIADGGYDDPRLWLSAGWDWVQANRIAAPLYWQRSSDRSQDWHTFTLHGLVPVDPHTPVVHVSYFEADAYARWAGARLASEFEWEHAAERWPLPDPGRANFMERGALHPMPPALVQPQGLMQLFGDAWEWTRSSYAPYPGFSAWDGAVGEYTAKFMCNQYVLRGGSCATPASHIRSSYRNFFPTDARWQFSGVRLARDAD